MADINSFEKTYNDIKNYLINTTNSDCSTKFHDLINKAVTNPVIKKYNSFLREINSLRNIVVHNKSDRSRGIAEPTKYAVSLINKIASSLLDPPKVIPSFQKDVHILQLNASLSKAVTIMYNQGFSQIPLYNDANFVGLLTTNTIVRWLGACVPDELCDLKDTNINNVFEKYTEDKDNYSFFKRSNSFYEVLEEFQRFESNGKKLDSILITENGSSREKLLGIITVWDLTEINKELS